MIPWGERRGQGNFEPVQRFINNYTIHAGNGSRVQRLFKNVGVAGYAEAFKTCAINADFVDKCIVSVIFENAVPATNCDYIHLGQLTQAGSLRKCRIFKACPENCPQSVVHPRQYRSAAVVKFI